jgi:hypothetical protein
VGSGGCDGDLSWLTIVHFQPWFFTNNHWKTAVDHLKVARGQVMVRRKIVIVIFMNLRNDHIFATLRSQAVARKLQSYGLTLRDVYESVTRNNGTVGGGYI